MNKISTHWDEEHGVARCVITTPGGVKVIGMAECAEQDLDMISEKVGCTIAERRAQIEYLRYIRDREIKPELKALKKFQNVINQSKYYNPADYSNQMLLRAIDRLEGEVESIKDDIFILKTDLNNYLKEKETFYQNVRKHRKSDQ